MKKIGIVLLVLSGIIYAHAQDKKGKPADDNTQNKPHVTTKVNRRYDDKGNVIGFDSVTTWSYSSNGGNMQGMDGDSSMSAFSQQFNFQFPSNGTFSYSFGNDSLFSDSMFSKFFGPNNMTTMMQWGNNNFDIEGMMRRMDSLNGSHRGNMNRNPYKDYPSQSDSSDSKKPMIIYED